MFSSFSSCREWILECSRLLNLWSTHAFLFFPTGLDVCRWGVGGLLRDIDPVGMVIGPDGCEVKVGTHLTIVGFRRILSVCDHLSIAHAWVGGCCALLSAASPFFSGFCWR